VGFFKKLFSGSYRKAVAAEGAGRYREAAENYALAGERAHVARMHRLAARSESDPYARVDAYRKSLDFLEQSELEPENMLLARSQIREELARALVDLVDTAGFMDRRDRAWLEEAAAIFQEQEAFDDAGEAFVRLGFVGRAADAFKAAGNIRRMEEMFAVADRQDLGEAAFDRAWDAYEFAIRADDPLGIVEALTRCVELRPQDASLAAQLARGKASIPEAFRIRLVASEGALSLVGGELLRIGRDDDNQLILPDPDVSRSHASIQRTGGGFELRDEGSRSGTWSGEEPVTTAVAIPTTGVIRLGRTVLLEYRLGSEARPSCIEVAKGHGKGERILWAGDFVSTGVPPDEPPWLPAGLAFTFLRGFWHVDADRSDGIVMLDGSSVSGVRLLLREQELAFEGVAMRIA
jgi:hypothetical protein